MNIIQKIKRRNAIRSYIKKLPNLLAKDYGWRKKYTPEQVRKTIERNYLQPMRVMAWPFFQAEKTLMHTIDQ